MMKHKYDHFYVNRSSSSPTATATEGGPVGSGDDRSTIDYS